MYSKSVAKHNSSSKSEVDNSLKDLQVTTSA